jgi:hydrogenase nickel incorporation protein HypB
MCDTCGCDGDGAVITHLAPSGAHTHLHPDGRTVTHRHDGHDHARDRFQVAVPAITLESLQVKVLGKNADLAARNRAELAARGVTAINLMSSPGAGKTTLLTRTLPALVGGGVAVIEGDQATAIDAERIAATGIAVVQVNTGKGCHLEADMVHHGLRQLAPLPGTLLVIENVGNLVCPALFDLGEGQRVVLLSVTEGDDKPRKYPHMFAVADVVVITKIDLLPHVDFDVARARASITELAPGARFFEVSARTGAGMPAWIDWLDGQRRSVTVKQAPWPAP